MELIGWLKPWEHYSANKANAGQVWREKHAQIMVFPVIVQQGCKNTVKVAQRKLSHSFIPKQTQ